MKTKIIYLLLCSVMICAMPIQEAYGQEWLKEVGQGVKNRAKNKVKKKIENKIYQKVDKAVDEAVDKVLGPTEETAEKAVENTVDRAASKAASRLQAATDSLASSIESLAAATGELTQTAAELSATAADISVEAAQMEQPEDTPENGALRVEIMKKYGSRPSGGVPFYPTRKDMVLTYGSGSGKGKFDSFTRTTITDVQWKNERNCSVSASSEILDADMNPVSEDPMTAAVTIEDGFVSFNPSTMAGKLEEGMEISGDFFMLPDNIEVGDTFPDYSITISIGGMSTVNKNSGISVTGRETLTVDGHKIDCYIIEGNSSVTVMGFKTTMVQKTWYGRGIGQVKQESHSKTGKLLSVYELTELKGY